MMPSSLINQIFAFTTGLGFLIVFILLFFSNGPRRPNRLLACSIFFLAYYMMVSTIYYNGTIQYYIHLVRTPSPFTYLIAPLAFLYARTVLKRERKFHRYDWAHFVPAVLHAVELGPFFIKSTAEKLNWLNLVEQDPEIYAGLMEGVLPEFMHTMLKMVLALGYFAAVWQMLFPFLRKDKKEMPDQFYRMVNWLVLFNGILTSLALFVLLSATIHDFIIPTQSVITIFVSVLFLTLLIILLFKPYVLYGIAVDPKKVEIEKKAKHSNQKANLSKDQTQVYKQILENHLRVHKPFLRQRYSLPELAEETGIPRHHLSAFINLNFGLNFNELINRYRIQHIIHHFGPELWEQLSLDGIGKEAGFNTRSTFLKAFKKNTGMKPSEFRDQLLTEK